MGEPDPNCDALDGQGNAAAYRCVCGNMVSLDGGPATCLVCGREYASDVLRELNVETTLIDLDGARSPERKGRSPKSAEDNLIGRKLGHFEIIDRLGGGGMGTVYRALDVSLQRYVALKVLRQPTGASKSDVQRLFEEARAQARVNDPHVAHIYFVGSDSEIPFLAMELVGSETLAHRLNKGSVPFHLVVRYALQLTKALHAAARYDIVHGDIKPANVLIVDDQTIKLSDFGLSYCLSDTGEPSTAISGTPDYMPPEVTRGGRINHQGDMYSLGVTLFVITFGRFPYDAVGSLEERLRQHRDSPVEFPNPWPAEIPLSWRRVLARLLNKNPELRYRDFTELTVDLDQLAPRLLPTASPLLRGLAWLVDGLLVSSPLTIIAIIASSNPFTHAALMGSVLSAGVCLGVCLLQGWWGTTPGKRLFQIRIADQHGLTPNRAVLAARASFQFMWAWSMALGELTRLLPLPNTALVVSVLVFLFLLVEMAFVMLAKGQSVHDRIFRTRVVLDAKGEHRR